MAAPDTGAEACAKAVLTMLNAANATRVFFISRYLESMKRGGPCRRVQKHQESTEKLSKANTTGINAIGGY